jgi:4-hydroxyproline epimerase
MTTSRVQVIDSHTGGEPTRVVIDGGPDLGHGTVAEKRERFRKAHDAFRAGIVNEPRGSDVLVGALLVPPADPSCTAGVIFFNNVGYLAMCGHGLIGVVTTLGALGKIQRGVHRIETSAGTVVATWHEDDSVSIENVPSWRRAAKRAVKTSRYGEIAGDIAWGGNAFFLVDLEDIVSANAPRRIAPELIPELLELAVENKAAVQTAFPSGPAGEVIDHIEISARSATPQIHSRNFVLCPGNAYDRSPCGTGTSAKLACLASDGVLAENELWVQQGIVGSIFAARYRWSDRSKGMIIPTITGRAHLTSEATLRFDAADPFCWGIA